MKKLSLLQKYFTYWQSVWKEKKANLISINFSKNLSGPNTK